MTLALGAALVARSAAAGGRLEYTASDGCEDEPAFVARVATRGGTFSPDSGDVLSVSLQKTADGYRGTLRVRSHGAESAPREVHGATCDEIADALAVVTAIELRPDEAPGPIPSAETAESAPPPKVEAPKPPPRPPARPPLHVDGAHTWPAPFQPGDREVHVEAGTLRFESSTSVTAGGGVDFGLIPGVLMPRVDLTFARANFVTLPNETSYLVGPIWRVRASLLAGTHRSGEYSTDIGVQRVSFGLCYAPLFDTGGLALLFCGDLGVNGIGTRTVDGAGNVIQKKYTGFGTTDLAVNLVYNLGRHFQIGAEVGGALTTNPVAAERADGSQLFHTSLVSGYGTIGLGGHW